MFAACLPTRARLLTLVYDELHDLASRHMRGERPDHTLQPTILVHEAYLRLTGESEVTWNGRAHFFGAAAEVMRRILVDHARRHQADKRGGGARRESLTRISESASAETPDLLALDGALEKLSGFDEIKGRVVELKFFGGLSQVEIGRRLHISQMHVSRLQRSALAKMKEDLSR